jgi:hypothetical protein
MVRGERGKARAKPNVPIAASAKAGAANVFFNLVGAFLSN